MTNKDCLRAAWYLDDLADCIFNSETVGGKWLPLLSSAKAKAEHDECRALAKKLRAAAAKAKRK